MCPIFDGSPFFLFIKYQNYLLVCWFLCKKLLIFLSLFWKLHNQSYHNLDVRIGTLYQCYVVYIQGRNQWYTVHCKAAHRSDLYYREEKWNFRFVGDLNSDPLDRRQLCLPLDHGFYTFLWQNLWRSFFLVFHVFFHFFPLYIIFLGDFWDF